ncbi:MAG: hypothetical protein R3220_07610 [Balneolaceae bacterium]|nr:hypothetical protein [Balneolaceae bacterium]
MNSDLIFHALSKRKWREFNKGGYFDPEGTRYNDGIVCVNSERLKEHINTNFKGRRQVMLLIIDKSRLVNKISFDKESDRFLIADRINMDAILDKIFIKPNQEGIFDIEVKEE